MIYVILTPSHCRRRAVPISSQPFVVEDDIDFLEVLAHVLEGRFVRSGHELFQDRVDYWLAASASSAGE